MAHQKKASDRLDDFELIHMRKNDLGYFANGRTTLTPLYHTKGKAPSFPAGPAVKAAAQGAGKDSRRVTFE